MKPYLQLGLTQMKGFKPNGVRKGKFGGECTWHM